WAAPANPTRSPTQRCSCCRTRRPSSPARLYRWTAPRRRELRLVVGMLRPCAPRNDGFHSAVIASCPPTRPRRNRTLSRGPSAHGQVPWGRPGPIYPPLVPLRYGPRLFAGEAFKIVAVANRGERVVVSLYSA